MSPRGTVQEAVRRTMLDAGGYWRPLAAVARLLEELGELGELLALEHPDGAELAAELADLWIITAALADQFLIEVSDPGAGRAPGEAEPGSLGRLLVAAGPIGRVVNYYDGPKRPRAGDGLPSLTDAVGAFHGQLAALCGTLGVELGAAVAAKLEIIRGRDMERFAREAYDPSTAPVLDQLDGTVQTKLWGAPDWRPGTSAAKQASLLCPSLSAFAKAALPEGLSGYVVGVPATPGSAELTAMVEELTVALRGLDRSPAVSALSFGGLALSLELLPAAGARTGPGTLALLRV